MSYQAGTLLSILLMWFASMFEANSQASESQKAATLKKPVAVLRQVTPINPVLDSINRAKSDTIQTILENLDESKKNIEGSIKKKVQIERKLDGISNDLKDIYTVMVPKKFSQVRIRLEPIPPSCVRFEAREVPYPEVSPDIDQKHKFWKKIKSIFKRKR